MFSLRKRSLLKKIKRVAFYCLLLVLIINALFPFYWMLITSLKFNQDIYIAKPILLPHRYTLQHYHDLLTKTNFPDYFKNSLLVASITTLFSTIISIFAAYALVRLRFKWREKLAKGVLLVYLVPTSVLFVPLYVIVARMGLANRIGGLIVTYPSFAVPFCTWMLISYLKEIPADLDEAALIDGCTHVQTLFRVILPVAAPGVIAASIFSFALAWEEYLYALVITTRETARTLPVGLGGFIYGDLYKWGQLMAGAIFASIPVIFIYAFAQRFLIQGLSAGSTKG